jgi:hypothetical protein
MSNDSRITEVTSSQREPERKQPSGYWASRQFFDSILNWLAGLIQLTEDEELDAGIYLGDQRYR